MHHRARRDLRGREEQKQPRKTRKPNGSAGADIVLLPSQGLPSATVLVCGTLRLSASSAVGGLLGVELSDAAGGPEQQSLHGADAALFASCNFLERHAVKVPENEESPLKRREQNERTPHSAH